jgi:hypothetical protein
MNQVPIFIKIGTLIRLNIYKIKRVNEILHKYYLF